MIQCFTFIFIFYSIKGNRFSCVASNANFYDGKITGMRLQLVFNSRAFLWNLDLLVVEFCELCTRYRRVARKLKKNSPIPDIIRVLGQSSDGFGFQQRSGSVFGSSGNVSALKVWFILSKLAKRGLGSVRFCINLHVRLSNIDCFFFFLMGLTEMTQTEQTKDRYYRRRSLNLTVKKRVRFCGTVHSVKKDEAQDFGSENTFAYVSSCALNYRYVSSLKILVLSQRKQF